LTISLHAQATTCLGASKRRIYISRILLPVYTGQQCATRYHCPIPLVVWGGDTPPHTLPVDAFDVSFSAP